MKKIMLLTVLMCLVVFAISAQAGPTPKDVNATVVNEPNVQVTNTPNVNVNNTPSVNVLNNPNVSVTNTPNVNVANTDPIPVTINNGSNGSVARIPFQYEATYDDWTGQALFAINLLDFGYTFADMLVIEHISAHFVMPDTQAPIDFIVLTGTGNSAQINHRVVIPPTIASDLNHNSIYLVSQSLRLYSDADHGVVMRLFKVPSNCASDFLPQCSATVTISGYVIPISSASLAP